MREEMSAIEPGTLQRIANFRGLRVLAWAGDVLYASRGYRLLKTRIGSQAPEWQFVGEYSSPLWRNLTASLSLSSRLFRDGFHALAVLSSGQIVAAVPGAILTFELEESRFRVSWRILRGTRPLHIAVGPNDQLLWGEYFNNSARNEVHIYTSVDRGATWHVAYTSAKRTVRHVHNIVYDPFVDSYWILTGDNGNECRILKVSRDFRTVDTIVSGNQQARTATLIPTQDALYFSSDTPFETNHIYRLDRAGNLSTIAETNGSSIYGCRVGNSIFFSTMVEPSQVNRDRQARVYHVSPSGECTAVLQWKKDRWPARLFQYGNAFLPDGTNPGDVLAVSTIALEGGPELSLWRI